MLCCIYLVFIIHNLRTCLYSRTCATGPSLFSWLLSEERLGVSLCWAQLCHALLRGFLLILFSPFQYLGNENCVVSVLSHAFWLQASCMWLLLHAELFPIPPKPSTGGCVWWYVVIKTVCISWFLRLLLLLVFISHLHSSSIPLKPEVALVWSLTWDPDLLICTLLWPGCDAACL